MVSKVYSWKQRIIRGSSFYVTEGYLDMTGQYWHSVNTKPCSGAISGGVSLKFEKQAYHFDTILCAAWHSSLQLSYDTTRRNITCRYLPEQHNTFTKTTEIDKFPLAPFVFVM